MKIDVVGKEPEFHFAGVGSFALKNITVEFKPLDGKLSVIFTGAIAGDKKAAIKYLRKRFLNDAVMPGSGDAQIVNKLVILK